MMGERDRSWVSLQIIENMLHILLKPVVSLSGRHEGAPHLVFEGHAFGIVFLKPPSAASDSENTLTWSTSPTCLLDHLVLGRFHRTRTRKAA